LETPTCAPTADLRAHRTERDAEEPEQRRVAWARRGGQASLSSKHAAYSGL
jgi:hypothetical protein